MIRRALIGLLLTMAPTLPAAGRPVALVMDIQGTGRLRVAGLDSPLVLLTELKAGCDLKLDQGSHLVLITLELGEEIQVQGPAAFRLDPSGRPIGKVQAIIKPLQALRLATKLLPGGLAQAGMVMREVDDAAVMREQILRPVTQSALLQSPSPVTREARPHFRWKAVPGAMWSFRLVDAHGQEVLHIEGASTEAELPPGFELKPGESYTWHLLETRPPDGSQRTTGLVRRLDAQASEALRQAETDQKAPFARRLLYASMLEQAGLQAEARIAWAQLLAERPDDAVLKAKLQ
jgi:hypothetical protein